MSDWFLSTVILRYVWWAGTFTCPLDYAFQALPALGFGNGHLVEKTGHLPFRPFGTKSWNFSTTVVVVVQVSTSYIIICRRQEGQAQGRSSTYSHIQASRRTSSRKELNLLSYAGVKKDQLEGGMRTACSCPELRVPGLGIGSSPGLKHPEMEIQSSPGPRVSRTIIRATFGRPIMRRPLLSLREKSESNPGQRWGRKPSERIARAKGKHLMLQR